VIDFTRPSLLADSQSAAFWTAAILVSAVAAYFVAGLAVYLVRCALLGAHRDADIDARGSSVLLGSWLRTWFAWMLRPFWQLLSAADIPPTAITFLSVVLAALAGASMAQGLFVLGGLLYLASGLCDFLDGRLARLTGQVTPSGAALDSVLDRYSEACMLIGLAWFYRHDWVLLVVLGLLAGSYQVPYVRARGEGLGVDMRVGLMQRPERMVLLGIAALLGPLIAAWTEPAGEPRHYWFTVAAIMLLAVSTQITAAGRLAHLVRVLDGKLGRSRGARRGLAPLETLAVSICLEFAVLVGLVERLGLSQSLAVTAAGTIGAWALYNVGSRLGGVRQNVLQAAVAGAGGVLLQVGGMAVLESTPQLGYMPAWWLLRCSVAAAWSYPILAQCYAAKASTSQHCAVRRPHIEPVGLQTSLRDGTEQALRPTSVGGAAER
jgi:phosphatidylglycerophosphate synthase